MICVYDDCFNNVVTSKKGGDNGNMVTLPWLPFHNRLMKLSYIWRSTTKMIDLNVYNTCVFVLCKRWMLWAQSDYILNSHRIRYIVSYFIYYFLQMVLFVNGSKQSYSPNGLLWNWHSTKILDSATVKKNC